MQKIEQYYGAYSIKLKGNPWWSSGAENVESRSLVCHGKPNALVPAENSR